MKDFFKIAIIKGKDITNVYKSPSYYTRSSMTGKKLGEFTRIYEDNPDKVNMLVIYEEDIIVTRALLWICDDGTKILDYIYGKQIIYDKEILSFRNKNKIISMHDKEFKENYKSYKITLNFKRNYVPFMDMFHYGFYDKEHQIIIVSCYPQENTNIVLTNHEGCCYKYYEE